MASYASDMKLLAAQAGARVKLERLIDRDADGVDEQGRLVWDPSQSRVVVEPDSHINVRGLPPFAAGLGGNDGDTFQAALDEARDQGIGVVWVPEGDYTVEKTIDGYDGVTLMLHSRARITFSSVTVGSTFYRVQGSESASTPLVAAAAENDSYLEVDQAWIDANDETLADNCLIRVMSEEFFANDPTGTGANLNGRIGELLYVGRPTSTLSAAIDDDDTTLTIARTGDARTSNFPRRGYLRIGDEVIQYTTIAATSTGFTFGSTSKPNVRGARSTVAATHAQGATVQMPDGMLAIRTRLQGGTYYPLANDTPTSTTLAAPLAAGTTTMAQLVDSGDMRSRGTVQLASGEMVTYTSVDYANDQLLGLTRGAGAIDQTSGAAVTQVDMARVSIVTPARKAALIGGTVISSSYAKQHGGARFGLTVDCDIDSVEFIGFASQAVNVTDSINHRVTKPRVIGDKSITSTFYGVVHTGACQDCTVTEGFFKDVRHATSNGAGTTNGGLVRRLNVITCVAYDATSTGFDCHAGAEDPTYTDCHVFGGDNAGTVGFSVRCPSARWIGCTVDGVGSSGWSLRNQTMTPSKYQLDGCSADNTGSASVYVANILGGIGVLASDLLVGATSATVESAAGFSSLGGKFRAGEETITYASRTGLILNGLTRGVDNTTEDDHFAGEEVERGRPGTGSNIKGTTINGGHFSRPGTNCIHIQSTDEFRLKNVTINGAVLSSPGSRHVYASNAESISISDVQFEGALAGREAIYFDNVIDSTIGTNPKIKGAGVGTSTTPGIYLVGCDGITVIGTPVRGFQYGVRADNNSTNCTVIGNDLNGNETWGLLPSGKGHLYRTATGSPLNQGDPGGGLDTLTVGQKLRVGQANSSDDGISAISAAMRGLELYSKSGNNSNAKYFPAIKVVSGDPDLGGEKVLGYIAPAATETYGASTDGGLEFRFYTTPKDGGASDPLLAMTIRDDQGVDIIGSVTSGGLALATAASVTAGDAATAAAAAAATAAALAVPRLVLARTYIVDDTYGTSVKAFRPGNTGLTSGTANTANDPIDKFWLDPARYPAVSGKTPMLRFIVAMTTNQVAPGQDLTLYLLKLLTSNGASGQTANTFSSSLANRLGTATFTAAELAASSASPTIPNKTSEVAMPASAGLVVPTAVAAGAQAAGARSEAIVTVEVFYV